MVEPVGIIGPSGRPLGDGIGLRGAKGLQPFGQRAVGDQRGAAADAVAIAVEPMNLLGAGGIFLPPSSPRMINYPPSAAEVDAAGQLKSSSKKCR